MNEKRIRNRALPMSTSESKPGNSLLGEEDVRSLIRILSDVSNSQDDLNSARVYLVKELAKLVDADFWSWGLLGEIDTEKSPASTIFLHGGFSETQLAQYLTIQEHPDLAWMTAPFISAVEQTNEQITRLHEQMASPEKVKEADIFPQLLDADIGPAMLSGRQTQQGQLSIISLFRSFEKPHFSPREAKITHILLSEVPWLHDTAWPHHPRSGISHLTGRQRTVLGLLLQGRQRKQIAEALALSVHTVNGYVKLIYETFDVHSHAEIIRRFHHGNGGDLVPPSG